MLYKCIGFMTAKVTNCKLGFLTSEQRGMCLQGPPGEKTGTFLNFSLSAGGSASLKGQRKLQFPFSKFSNSLAGRFGGNSCSPESPTDLPSAIILSLPHGLWLEVQSWQETHWNPLHCFRASVPSGLGGSTWVPLNSALILALHQWGYYWLLPPKWSLCKNCLLYIGCGKAIEIYNTTVTMQSVLSSLREVFL